MSDILTFLQAFYGPAAALWPEWFFQTLCLAPKGSGTKPQGTSWRLSNLEAAATYLENIGRLDDTFTSMGIAATGTQPPGRWKADEVQRLCGVWVDVDLADEKHKHRPESTAQALELVWAAPLPPTIVTLSGSGGCHGFWVYEAPEDVATALPAERAWLALIARGHKLDSVFDATRVMRVPGTINLKNREMATLAGGELTRWVSYATVVAAAPVVPRETTGASQLEGTNSRTTGPTEESATSEGDMVAQIDAQLMDPGWNDYIDDLRDSTGWAKGAIQRTKIEGGDESAHDHSLAICAALEGLPIEVGGALVTYSRLKYCGAAPDDHHMPANKDWPAYLLRTLAVAYDTVAQQRAREQRDQESSQQAFRWNP